MQNMMNELETLARDIGEMALRQEVVITTAESCTAGGVAYALTAVPGSSAWFEEGFVTYSNQAKIYMLNVKSATLDKYGAVSKEIVLEMADGALTQSDAQLSVAISGIAGPDGGTDDKPVGTVWFAWVGTSTFQTECHCFEGGRQSVREQAIRQALEGLKRELAHLLE